MCVLLYTCVMCARVFETVFVCVAAAARAWEERDAVWRVRVGPGPGEQTGSTHPSRPSSDLVRGESTPNRRRHPGNIRRCLCSEKSLDAAGTVITPLVHSSTPNPLIPTRTVRNHANARWSRACPPTHPSSTRITPRRLRSYTPPLRAFFGWHVRASIPRHQPRRSHSIMPSKHGASDGSSAWGGIVMAMTIGGYCTERCGGDGSGLNDRTWRFIL